MLDGSPCEVEEGADGVATCGSWSASLDAGASGRRLSSTDAGTLSHSDSAWLHAWRESISCWWIALAEPTQHRLRACMGALALHLGGRLDLVWRATQAFVGRLPSATASAAASVTASATATSSTSECDWISADLALPELPPFPEAAEFRLPPIPRLLPTWQHLQSLGMGGRVQVGSGGTASPKMQVVGAAEESGTLSPAAAIVGVGVGAATAGSLLLVLRYGHRQRRVPTQHKSRLNVK